MAVPAQPPMILTTDLNPNTGFTRVLNEAIFDERLSHAEFRMWCMLLALPKGKKSINITAEEIAKETGMKLDSCRLHRRNLKAKGFLATEDGALVVTIPPIDFEPEEIKLSEEQQLRHDLRDAWNANKPDAYSKLRHPLSEAQVETLQAHAQHNGEYHLDKLLAAVLKGCKADDWWKGKNLSFNNVFGTGTPKQNKFTNVEKLFKLAGSTKGRAALFDVNDDKCWLDWYESKGHTFSKIVRLEKERWDAFDHETENRDDGVLYLYSHEGSMVHWTLKEDQAGVSYLPTAR